MLRFVLAVGMAGVLIVVVIGVIRELDRGGYELQALLHQIGWSTLVGLALLYLVALTCVIWVWGSIMSVVATPIPWRDHWYIYTVSSITRRLPGTLWHVGYRTVLYQAHGIPKRAVAFVSGLELAFMMLSGALLLLGIVPAVLHSVAGGWRSLAVVGGVAVALMALGHPASWQRLRRLGGIDSDRTILTLDHVVKWFVGYGGAWLAGGMMVALLAHRLHPLPPAGWLAAIGGWVLASLLGMMIIILPSGFGVTELSLTVILAAYMPAPLAAVAALGTRLVLTALELGWAIFLWVILGLLPRITRKGYERVAD